WIRGRGWHEGKWDAPAPGAVRGFPTHAALTAVSPDNPVVLERADGHATLANSRAMALKGISRDTRAPSGGEIVRDFSGEATGVFVDNAQGLVAPPERTPGDIRRALELATDECLAKGVTSLTDAGAGSDVIALYREAAAAGRLRLRLYVMAAGLQTMKALGRPDPGRGMLAVRAVKLYADGALGSRGAALLEPYADDPGNSGLLVTPAAEILEAARFALAHGFQVGTHAIGDRANRIVLDAYEAAFRENPSVRDPRFRIEHAQILAAPDIPRFGKLGVLASMQGIHCPSDRPWTPKRLGDARVAEGAYAWRKLLDAGARILNGTDAPVEDVSPIQNFHATVTRQDASGQPPGGFDPDQKLTRREALRTMTLDAAYGSFAEKEKGSIEVGKLADLVVLSQDIQSVPDDAILKTEVLATIVDGRVLFGARNLHDLPRGTEGRTRERENRNGLADWHRRVWISDGTAAPRSSPSMPPQQIGEEPPPAGDPGRDLAEEGEAHVGPGSPAHPRLDEEPPLLAGVVGEGVGRGEKLHVARVPRGQELDAALLHPALPVTRADGVRRREQRMARSEDAHWRRLVADAFRRHRGREGNVGAGGVGGQGRCLGGEAIEGRPVVLDDEVAARFDPPEEPVV
ncbi:MAG TPA: amidohydrolase, partial [Vicinamibacteria bacterium]|nr:amidohydrolase [Vicinamibacteria bacterium]